MRMRMAPWRRPKESHEYDTWLGMGHTVPNGDPAEPFAPGTGLSGILLLPSISLAAESHHASRADGEAIDFLTLYPVHTDEMELKLSEGTDALLDLFEAAQVSDIVDPARPSAVGRRPRKGWFRRR
jgi:Suppressor of fused protein (SUFU)